MKKTTKPLTDYVSELQKGIKLGKKMRLKLEKAITEEEKRIKRGEEINPYEQMLGLDKFMELFGKLTRSMTQLSDQARQIEKTLTPSDEELDERLKDLGYVILEEISTEELLAEARSRGIDI